MALIGGIVMFCIFCGKEIDDNAKFCPNCGKPVANDNAGNDTVNQPQTAAKGKNFLLPVLITIGGVLVIVIGVCVWMLVGENSNESGSTLAENNSVNQQQDGKSEVSAEADPNENNASNNEEDQAASPDTNADAELQKLTITERETLLGGQEEIYYDTSLVPSVEPYTVAPDFSNVEYAEEFAYLFDPQYDSEYNNATALRNSLIKNSFAVVEDGNDEFFDVYESNRYDMFPNFITVDSLMHTYHLYFSYLMKNTEKNYLSNKLYEVSTSMLNKSVSQYQQLIGSEYEVAARNNVVFFYVGCILLDENTELPLSDSDISQMAMDEYNKIMEASGMDKCKLTDEDEDYTQYKPRGYYEGDEALEKYFRSMMWYGRVAFTMDKPDNVKSAILMTKAIEEDPTGWESIYQITGFFAGASDDLGYDTFSEVLKKVYGENAQLAQIVEDTAAFESLCQTVKTLEMPKINSVPVAASEDNVNQSFRFMGQRFSIDGAIMQQLVYRSVEEDSSGDRRYLPDTLDTAAVLGSDMAYSILEEQGDTSYKNYSDNVTLLKGFFDNSDPQLWNASLYSGWLNTLRPLFERKSEGYPSYMNSDEWAKKNLETFAGSYAELKHDTILYSKQLTAEMGGGDEIILDDRGYVDPQPVIYSRFVFLSNKTKEGLESFGMLDDTAKQDLERLSEIAMTLLKISEKELKNEALTDEEYEFIRCYGGYLEHFWIEANKGEETPTYSYQAPCPVVADIATDPNGSVLEVGSGKADTIYVVFPFEGKLRVGSGSAYSFYQFTVPMGERLTDSEWRAMLSGGYMDENWNWVESEEEPEKPAWTMSYRLSD